MIKVEDVELPESNITTADVLISQIKSLVLDSEGYLIEQG